MENSIYDFRTDCLLRKYRRKKGLTQTELAKLVHVSRPMISYYENRFMYPSIDLANRLAYFLDCKVSDIFPCSIRL